MEILTFQLEAHRFALKLGAVEEVIRAVSIAPLPGAPSVVHGVINVRGRIVPVLDLRRRFDIPPKPLDLSDVFILVAPRGGPIALRVDTVGWPIKIADDDIETVDGTLGEARFVLGVARAKDGLIVITDLDEFLSSAEEAELRAALEDRESEPV